MRILFSERKTEPASTIIYFGVVYTYTVANVQAIVNTAECQFCFLIQTEQRTLFAHLVLTESRTLFAHLVCVEYLVGCVIPSCSDGWFIGLSLAFFIHLPSFIPNFSSPTYQGLILIAGKVSLTFPSHEDDDNNNNDDNDDDDEDEGEDGKRCGQNNHKR